MKQLLVIFFAFMMLAKPVSAQQSDRKSVTPIEFKSKAQKNVMLKEFKHALETSKAYAYTNSLAIDGTKIPLKGKAFESMLTEQNTEMRFSSNVGPGTHTLSEVSSAGTVTEVVLQDTILEYAILDLSNWVRIASEDEGDLGFLLQANQVGTSRIFKSFVPSEEVEGGAAASAGSTGAEKSAKADTTKSDSTYTPELVRKDNLGKRDVLSFYNPTTGMYEVAYDGRRSRWPYRNDMSWKTRNGFYDGGWGLVTTPIMASTYYPYYTPVYGGGWGGGYGYGGCGFSAGFGINFGWSSGCGYVNNNFCQPNYGYGGSSTSFVWTANGITGINWLGSGVGWSPAGYGGGYNNGYGVWKSNVVTDNSAVETEQDYELASADEKSFAVPASGNKSLRTESLMDIAPTKDLTASSSKTTPQTKEGRIDPPMASRDIPLLKLPASHSSTIGGRTASNSGAKPVNDDRSSVTLPRSHGATKPVKPAGNSNNEFASTSSNRRQGNNSVQSAPNTKPGSGMSSGRVANTPSRGNRNGQVSVSSNRVQTKPNRNQGSMNNTSVYGNTKPSQRNGGNVNRGGGSKPQIQQRGSQRGGAPNVSVPQRTQQRSAKPMRSAPQQLQAKPMRQSNSGPKRR